MVESLAFVDPAAQRPDEPLAVNDYRAQRLFCDVPLGAGEVITCDSDQANYLLNVLRLATGDSILVFNGVDGEWRTTVAQSGKRRCSLEVVEQVRTQSGGPDIDYLFAPLKRARLDYMVQKATELGVGRLRPVYTRHTVAERVNLQRMKANVIEASEQCGILRLPTICEPKKLSSIVAEWQVSRTLIFADESAKVASPLAVLEGVARGPCAVLVGPEGGFAEAERNLLLHQSFTVPISLGPRIMRADTAAVAALALINSVLGDWR